MENLDVQAALGKLMEVHTLATELLDEYELSNEGWKFVFDKSLRRVGQCRFRDKEIGYSIHRVSLTPMREIENTLRHEIAHAIVGPGHGHDWVWREMCIEVGARPERCARAETISDVQKKSYFECPACGNKLYRHRIKSSMIGRKSGCCGAPLRGVSVT